MSVIVTLGALVASNVVLLMFVFKFATCAYYINKRKALYNLAGCFFCYCRSCTMLTFIVANGGFNGVFCKD